MLGQVVSVTSGWDRPQDMLYTYVGVQVAEVIKGGGVTSGLTVKQLGGRMDDDEFVAFDQAEFVPGEEVLLFLEIRPRDGTVYTARGWEGKWTIDRNRSLITRRHPRNRHGGSAVDERPAGGFMAAVREIAVRAPRDPIRARLQPLEAPPPSSAQPYRLFRHRWHEVDLDGAVFVDGQEGGQPGLSGGGLNEILTGLRLWTEARSALILSPGQLRDAACNGLVPRRSDHRITVSFNDPCNEIDNTGTTFAIGARGSTA